MRRLHNFSAGPCTLPLEVLETAQRELVDYHGAGMSLLEMSHRTPPVEGVRDAAEAALRRLLGLGEHHHVAFVAGGATFQFAMLAMNFLTNGRLGDYTHSGAWAKKAIADGRKIGRVNVVWDGTPDDYMTLPDPASVSSSAGSQFLHLTSNETIGGVQWKSFPACEAPLVADMSSDFLSRPVPLERFGLIYAGAQKNIGPAGVTVVILTDDMLAACDGDLPGYLNYGGHVQNRSMLNTPPVFQIYMVKLVLEWLEARGGLAWAEQAAAERSGILYGVLGGSDGFYRCPVDERYRSTMNVVFRLPSEELEKRFVAEAEAAGLSGLKGHRSVGGIRASIYNAMPVAGVEALAGFMSDFRDRNG
ncbi:3-phosphoserine/phosphohydroxythreonine transaminase [Phycisphaera mikurensis]|uniref:Phosphoserine aminotransferase n=1 Tax=Phycisphaera mikurensis (strain NBRC 102666 / KCTC 22515 / FYK2301M01) TaxID=1142394 RepID=I0IFQ1_PHYMF|nr:3-phosphoserine/phosphohydroxythreonine transaminase [Phycisphaera mikurensis]MBB6440521.1 phosphoserine aminotransferase [Phycisphaera mikurensis]BAM04089.1 phosphoserine aminotransferase [Phycisphaera mikurensis NBRC 102666]